MTVNFAHCLFEQSGTFKKEFQKMGIAAKDYDIQNDFGETDVIVDLFHQIELAYEGRRSIFSEIAEDDLIIAFFPCIYFCETNMMYFCGTNNNLRALSPAAKIETIMERSWERQRYYALLLMLFQVCETRHLRLIVENPYNAHHYLRFNFPYKPAVIDMNRRLSGDSYRKPTQYFFLNCTPAGKNSIQMDKPEKYIRDQSAAKHGGLCSSDRSLIHPDYAHNFICDHILGIESGHTMPTLFDNLNN